MLLRSGASRYLGIINMKEEVMNDTIDDAMGDEDDEEESKAVVGKTLAELGLENVGKLNSIAASGVDPCTNQNPGAEQLKQV